MAQGEKHQGSNKARSRAGVGVIVRIRATKQEEDQE
jgi:hypothetical protein